MRNVCFYVLLLCILAGYGQESFEAVEERIKSSLASQVERDRSLSDYVDLRMEQIYTTFDRYVLMRNAEERLITLAREGVETIRRPLRQFEAIMNLVNGERFLAHRYIHRNKDYVWQLTLCDLYVAASRKIKEAYSELFILISDEVNTCDVFEYQKTDFLKEFRKFYLEIGSAPLKLYEQHMAMGEICKKTIELLQNNDGHWTMQRDGNLFFDERSVVIELNDLVNIMDEIDYSIQDYSEEIDQHL